MIKKKLEKPEIYYTEIIKDALPKSGVFVLHFIFFFLSDNQICYMGHFCVDVLIKLSCGESNAKT